MMMKLFNGLDDNFWSSGRIKTYEKWPFKPGDGTCTAERMAAAGFFVVNGDDEADISVECFICMKQLDGWEPNDDPWQEHAKHQADCPYILLNKREEMQWTFDDLFALIKAYYVNHATRKRNEVVNSLKSNSLIMAKKIPKIYKMKRNSRKGGN